MGISPKHFDTGDFVLEYFLKLLHLGDFVLGEFVLPSFNFRAF